MLFFKSICRIMQGGCVKLHKTPQQHIQYQKQDILNGEAATSE